MSLLRCFVAIAWLAASACAQEYPTAPPGGMKAILTLRGVGVQIYNCTRQAAGPTWTFVAPDAKLLDHEAEVGNHSAGPTWTLKDGSSVKGQVVVTQPSPDENAIPWLLLKAVATGGSGVLTKVEYIRRTDTTGGRTHAVGCDAEHLGTTDHVPYTAVYTFYTSTQ